MQQLLSQHLCVDGFVIFRLFTVYQAMLEAVEPFFCTPNPRCVNLNEGRKNDGMLYVLRIMHLGVAGAHAMWSGLEALTNSIQS